MAANETTPLLGDVAEERNSVPSTSTVAAANSDTEQNGDQQNIQDSVELKFAAVTHLVSVVTSAVAAALGLVYWPLSRDAPRYAKPPSLARDLAIFSVNLGVITMLWGIANFLMFYYRRRLLGPAFLSFVFHAICAGLSWTLYFSVIQDHLFEYYPARQCQSWEGGQYLPGDPECFAWVKRLYTLFYTALVFFLGFCVSQSVLVYLYFVWTWRQCATFLRSLPWSRPQFSAQNGNYRGSIPVPIVPRGGISFEIGLRYWGRESAPQSDTEAEQTTPTSIMATCGWILVVLVSIWLVFRILHWIFWW
ncbi:hypothetical protein QBC40DRAFT_207798 [Triangularia verruculosa]|uniref:Uncharacterized protein n=1 Tax=Triangularia verruculosa TaxID=2587418 RepID=A0AAN6XAJ6_9PEZI|nr:hypothetical protein QBC40DRAFT_207798 [Triangularia verruculosa]